MKITRDTKTGKRTLRLEAHEQRTLERAAALIRDLAEEVGHEDKAKYDFVDKIETAIKQYGKPCESAPTADDSTKTVNAPESGDTKLTPRDTKTK